jgi:2-polyprenyl-3-methyl-5-hydroxy-6-metoxy-1,4-benzoquinol methylase
VGNYQSGNLQKYKNPNPLQQWLLRRFFIAINDLLPNTNWAPLLDAGCGEGLSIEKIAANRHVYPVYGLDLSFRSIQLAQKIVPQSLLLQGSVLALPFNNESFQVVICLEVLEHLDEPANCLQELLRVAKGYVLLSVPNEPAFQVANFLRGKNLSRLGNDIDHLQHWTARKFIRFVQQYTQVIAWRTSFPWTIALCHKES